MKAYIDDFTKKNENKKITSSKTKLIEINKKLDLLAKTLNKLQQQDYQKI